MNLAGVAVIRLTVLVSSWCTSEQTGRLVGVILKRCRGVEGCSVPIHELLQRQDSFDSDEVAVLGNVFDAVLRALGLVDRREPMTTVVAKKLLELASAGVRDPERLKHLTLQAFSEPFRPSDVN
jgi:hypothetical protein